jgi:(1->4)-alpha-D-glucan 1-alpha-D-glucosylmutase
MTRPGASRRSRAPLATCRLQLRPEFTFEDAARVVPYLAALGISHLYLSPVFAAAPGSTHGYDVVDHGRVNPTLGGLSGLYTLAAAARDHDMGLILDIVPNHVGIAGGANPWWRDVMRSGRRSRFASFFDIDWEGQPQMSSGVLVYPVLGQSFGAALEAGELRAGRAEDGELVVHYFDHSYPLATETYLEALGLPPPDLRQQLSATPDFDEYVGLLEGLRDAPAGEADSLLAGFRKLLTVEPALQAHVDERLAALAGTPGEPATFDRLEALLRRQHYRLASWRVSGEEMNYRRFFDVNDLAAIRVEQPEVFEAVHALTRDLLANDVATGLRVDHVDGLYDPHAYLDRLHALAEEAMAAHSPARFSLHVEKILAEGEELPASWPVDGTTGYDFLAVAGDLLVDPAGEQGLTATYEEFTGDRQDFAAISFAARRRVAERSFAGEMNVLALQLHRIAQGHRLHRDLTLRALREALAALLACFPVYRTYLEDDQPRRVDAAVIRGAAREAQRRDPNVTHEALAFLIEVLLVEGVLSDEERARRLHFRRRFEQISGPVMAKGMEDTTFFRYHRLLALNEVGGEPGRFGRSPEQVHRWFERRAQAWPLALSATTTHDTKRGEDARMRLSVLSELPREWRTEVRAWARLNRRWLADAQGRQAPEPNMEYYLYQTLVAAWEGRSDADFQRRVADHIVKAAREARLQTSWIYPDEAYESALAAFTRAVLDRRRSARFLERLARFVTRLAPAASVNSLALLALKCLAPGIPDFYQGSEWADHSLTDPDNRRLVDWAARTADRSAASLLPPEPVARAAKPWLTRKLLRLRCEHADLVSAGAYRPLAVEGPLAPNLFAFSREHAACRLVAVVPRHVARLVGPAGSFIPAALEGTVVRLPAAASWHNALTGERLSGQELPAATLVGGYPLAVLVGEAG